jgi:hypothetical protein
LNTPRHQRSTVLAATVGAVVAGSLIVLVAVLPAEYGIDPTGVGKQLGLLQLAPDTAAGLQESRPLQADRGPAATGRPASSGDAEKSGTHEIALAPGMGIEFKLEMQQGQRLAYRWLANGIVHTDLHGEPAGDTSGYYESYVVTDTTGAEGRFTALFDGVHGWYWRNDGDAPVVVDLRFRGHYVRESMPPPGRDF